MSATRAIVYVGDCVWLVNAVTFFVDRGVQFSRERDEEAANGE